MTVADGGGSGIRADGGGSGLWVIGLEMLVIGSEIGEASEVVSGDVVTAGEVGALVVCDRRV